MRTLTLDLGGEYLRAVSDGASLRLWRWTQLDRWQPAVLSEWTLRWEPSPRPGADVVEVQWHGVRRPASVAWGLVERDLLRRLGDPAKRRLDVELDVGEPYTERAMRRRGQWQATQSQRVESADSATRERDDAY